MPVRLLAVLALLSLSLGLFAVGQWNRSTGPEGGVAEAAGRGGGLEAPFVRRGGEVVAAPAAPGPPPPSVSAPTAILVDVRDGTVLFAKHPNQRRPIASVTKIMTAMLVLDRGGLADTITVSRRAAKQPPIDIGLRVGQRITVRNLLWGLLLWSGNDTSVALAEHVAGSVPAFLRLMNGRAGALGLRDTHFASPSGLNDDGYSTVHDVAALARAALRYPVFARTVRTRSRWIPGPRRQVHKLRNLNDLLRTYRGARGVKTGYPRAAGDCVVGAATRGGRSLVAVVLGEAPETHWVAAYGDVSRLLDFGFALPAR